MISNILVIPSVRMVAAALGQVAAMQAASSGIILTVVWNSLGWKLLKVLLVVYCSVLFMSLENFLTITILWSDMPLNSAFTSESLSGQLVYR